MRVLWNCCRQSLQPAVLHVLHPHCVAHCASTDSDAKTGAMVPAKEGAKGGKGGKTGKTRRERKRDRIKRMFKSLVQGEEAKNVRATIGNSVIFVASVVVIAKYGALLAF